jgi:Leucine-rich repeat (LRR) protein
VWLQYYAEYQRGSGSKRRRGRGGGAGGADEQGDLYEDHGVPDDDDDDDPGASPLSSADPLLYRVPAAIAALPDDGSVRIQEAMNSLLEETLDDVDRLLLELERLGEGGGVDLESDEFFAAAEYGEDEGDDEDFDDEDFDGSGGFGSDDDYGEGGEEGGGSERGPAAAPRRSGTAKPKARPYEAWADGVEFAAYDYGGGGGADADGEDAGEQGAGAGAREGLVGPAAAMWAVDPGELGALEAVLGEVGAPPDLRSEWRWLDAGHHYCSWGGVYCGPAPPRRGRGGGGVVGPAPPRASTDEDAAEAEAAAEVVVIRIELPRAGLSGSVPRSAARLKHLQVLNLANNRLGGTLPAAELANLTRASLRVLDLSHNRLSGTVPLSQLLGAGGSSHGGEELPEAGGSASVLEELRLSFNHFTGSLAPLEAAAEPALSAAAAAASASGSRSVKGGASSKPPPPNATSSPARASPLRWLDLSANDLTGPLPGALLSGLSDLEVLLLGDNFFADDGAPFPDLRNLSSLEAVDVGHNLLGGPAGSLVSGLPDGVEQVNAGRNLFNGTLPADLWRLSGLQVLLLSDNQMTGPLPTAAAAADDDSYGALRDLRVWWMARNGLQGPLPRDLFVGLQSSLEMYGPPDAPLGADLARLVRGISRSDGSSSRSFVQAGRLVQ